MSFLSGTNRSVIAKVESNWGVLAGTGSAKKFRRTAFNMNLRKDRYSSAEIRDDRQKSRASSGGERVEGTLDCELSCGSHQEFFEAQLCKVAAAVTTITGLTLTTIAGTPNVIDRSSGDWIADGVRAGMVVRVTAGLAGGSLNRNIFVTGVDADEIFYVPIDGGAAFADESGVAACSVVIPGKRIIVPSTGHIERSFTAEDLMIGTTISRRFTGMEVNTLALDFTPGQNARASFGFMGKDMDPQGAAYFVSPSALSTVPVLSGPKGVILIDGVIQAFVTQFTANVNANLSVDAVIGSTAPPAIGQGSIVGTGSMQILLQNKDFIDKYKADTPFEVAIFLKETAAANSDFMLFHMADCLASSADLDDGERILKNTIPFDFTKKPAATGYDETTMSIQDSRYV